MVPTGRNSRAPGGSLLQRRVSPTEGKPPAASGLLEEQLQFCTQKSSISQSPSFSDGKQPQLLLASSPAAPETQRHRRATSCTHQPQAVTPRNQMSCGIHPLGHAQGREERWRAKDEHGKWPTHLHILSFSGFRVSWWVLCCFPPHPEQGHSAQLGSVGGTAPAQALAAPLMARCYLVSRDSRYSSAMS